MQTSHEEGTPTVFQEAMLHGLPIVTTPNMGVETIYPGLNGFVSQNFDVESLKTLLIHTENLLMRNKISALKLHKHAQGYTWQHLSNRFDDLLKSTFSTHSNQE